MSEGRGKAAEPRAAVVDASGGPAGPAPARPALAATLMPTLVFCCYLVGASAAGMLLLLGLRVYALSAGWTAAAGSAAAVALAIGATAGALLGGLRARRVTAPLAGLGIALAAFGALALLGPVLFDAARALQLALAPSLGEGAGATWSLRLLLGLALLAPPAAAFSAAPYALARAIVARPDGLGLSLGFAFGLAFAGLGLGIVAAPFVLDTAGLRGTLAIGAALAGMAASGIVLIRQRGLEGPGAIGTALAGTAVEGDTPVEETGVPSVRDAGILGATMTLFGFYVAGTFIVWQRTLTLTVGPTTIGKAVVASIFCLSLALGAVIAAGFADRIRRPIPALAVTLTAIALLAFATMYRIPSMILPTVYLRLSPLLERPGLGLVPAAAVCLLLMFPAALLMGAALPLLPLIARARGRATAGVIGFGSAGAALAALTIPLLGIPAFGLRRTMALTCAVMILGVLLLVDLVHFRVRATRYTVVLVLVLIMFVVGGFPGAWDTRVVASGLYRYGTRTLERFGSVDGFLAARRGAELAAYWEGENATVAVERTVQAGAGGAPFEALTLAVDGKIEAATGTDLRAQTLQAHIPLLVHGPAEEVLLTDLLNGVTAGSALLHPIKRLTVIEREPSVRRVVPAFSAYNHDPLKDDRLRLLHDEARARLAVDRASYDVIVVAALEPWLPHGAARVTAEGIDLLRSRLRPGGVLALRLPLGAAPEAALRSIIGTVARRFDGLLLFEISPEDLLLVASDEALALDVGWFRNVIGSSRDLADDLRRSLVIGPHEILHTFRLGGDGVRAFAAGAPDNRDDAAPVEVASVRALRVHHNPGLIEAMDKAWTPILPRVANYGAVPREKAEFLYGLAKSYLGLAGDPVRARDLADDLEALGEPAMARWVRGECLLQQSDIDGALGAWSAVLDLDPRSLDALFSLGTYHLDARDYWKAEPYLAKAARFHPDAAVVRYHLGRTLFHLGRHREAITELRAAERIGGEREAYPLVPYMVGIAAHKLDRQDEARAALEAYLKWAYTQPLTRVEVDAHLKLADVYDRQGRRFQAHRERQKADDLRRRIDAAALQSAATPAPSPAGPDSRP